MKSVWFSIDVEADGPYPPTYSMTQFGVVVVSQELTQTFHGKCLPLAESSFIRESRDVAGISDSEIATFPMPADTMSCFRQWLQQWDGIPLVAISDNPAFDWQFLNYYLWKFTGGNPFGHSARRIGDLFCGVKGNIRASWKHLRKTPHTHNPVDDAKGNAEVLLTLADKLHIPLLGK